MSLSIEERQLVELRIRNDAPSLVGAYVMWGVLGLISAHRFYLGRPRSAVLQILSLVTVVGWFIWWLYDAVMISAYIRDDKNALRVQLVSEMEGERRGPAPQPRAVETPVPPAPAKTPPPLAAAAAMPANPGKAPAEPDLVLLSKPGQPLVLGEPKPEPVKFAALEPAPVEPKLVEAAAVEATPKVAIRLDERAEAQAAATLAFSPPEPTPAPAPAIQPEPEPAAKTIAIPHPEVVDDSPIEIFPPRPAEPAPHKETEWLIGEPLTLDRNP